MTMPLLFVFLWAGLWGCGATKPIQGASTEAKITPEVAGVGENGFAQGLSAVYYEGFYRHVDDMPSGLAARFNGEPGKPIPVLDHRFGSGLIFDSGRSRGVGVELTGFIHLPRSGSYQFKARANDGIRFFAGDRVIFEDPAWHSDRFSPAGEVFVDAETRVPVKILYFQRKGTATLEMYWKLPGQEEFEIIPAQAYCHKKEKQ